MIRVLIKDGIIGQGRVDTAEIPHGLTAAQISATIAEARTQWHGLRIGVAVNGLLLSGTELDQVVTDGAEVVVAPNPAGIEIGTLLLTALVSAAASYAVNAALEALAPKPTPPGVPQERDDSRSQTYDAGGITTAYGQGFPVPLAYGEHDVGGQVIHSEVVASSLPTAPGRELVRLVLCLGDGRIDSIGGQDGGALGEINAHGGYPGGPGNQVIPSDIRIQGTRLDHTNTTPGALVWFRLGEIDQSPLPPPFAGARITEIVGEQLNSIGAAVHTIEDTGAITTVAFVLVSPAGFYSQSGGTLSNYPVNFDVSWRQPGGAWQPFYIGTTPVPTIRYGFAVISFAPYSETVQLQLRPNSADVTGPIEVRLERLSAQGGQQTVDQVVWRQVTWGQPHAFSYPRRVILGLELQTSELISGNPANSIICRARHRRVRAWDPVAGWSIRWWGPVYSYTHPIGQNPAWILVDFMVSKAGLGKWITEANLDLPAFAGWAVHCDISPAGWNEARYAFDGVLDAPRPAWESAQMIAAAAHASLIMRGEKISVSYRYRDQHILGNVVVPAKTRSQLFASPNVRNLTRRWLPTAQRPRVIEYQFLNRDKDFSQDTFPVEDPAANFNDPTALYRDQSTKKVIQAFGIVRTSQLFRMGILEHNLARLTKTEVTFEVPYQALAAEIGDVIALQTDVLRPFGPTAVPARGMTIRDGGVGTSGISVDQDITLEAGKTYAIIVRTPDLDVDEADITTVAGSYPAGTLLSLSTSVTCDPGSVCAIGVKDQIVVDYQIVAITLAGTDLARKVRALLWVPEAYDDPDPADAEGLLDPPTDGGADIGQGSYLDQHEDVDPDSIVAVPSPRRGGYLIGFARPPGRTGGRARVYYRAAGGASWVIAGETLTDSVEVPFGILPWSPTDVAVSLEDRRGRFRGPVESGIATIVPEEIPPGSPPTIIGARMADSDGGIVVRWDPQETRGGDYYEVRRGAWPHTARIIDRTSAPLITIPQPKPWAESYFVARRRDGGAYSDWVNAQDPGGLAVFWAPPGKPTQVINSGNLVSGSPTGTLTGLEYGADPDDPVIAGFRPIDLEGEYEAVAITLVDGDTVELEAAAAWYVTADLYAIDLDTIDDWITDGWQIGCGESDWRLVDFRPPTLIRPGISRQTIDQMFGSAMSLDELEVYTPDLLTGAWAGHAGERAFVAVESRFYVGGAWSSWAPHEDGVRIASRIQVRCALVRESRAIHAYLTTLSVDAYL